MQRLEFTTYVPGSLSAIWDFFSSPANLGNITPPEMRFQITSPDQDQMYEGMVISYRVSPMPMMRINWLTEITHIRENIHFIDEQRIGPYNVWHHEHHFKEVDGGVEMKDILIYSVPFGILGRLVDVIMVRNKVKAIFSFREQRIRELFPSSK
ncbi:MAG: SRPBCC family protein [Bacteroidetes bacterium]|nr:SRPBCC family protein [Bacteroidota bacterium]